MAKRFGYTFADWAEDHALSTIVWLLACLAGVFAGQSLHTPLVLWTLGYFTAWAWLSYKFNDVYWGDNPAWDKVLYLAPAAGFFLSPLVRQWLFG